MSDDYHPHQRITGQAREELAEDTTTMYRRGMSIRAISKATGRSYGAVHRLLSDNGVELRGRGTQKPLTSEQEREYRQRLASKKRR